LLEAGANLFVSDINEESIVAIQERAKQLGSIARVISGDEVYSVEADVFVPCAFGGIINDETIEQLKVKAVVGSANNQLLLEKHGESLKQKGILYAPDYIVNAGGLIQVADELYGYNKERVLSKTRSIYTSLLEVYRQAELDNITTIQAANRLCEKRMEDRKRQNSFFTHAKRPKWDIRK
jgi:phenylalanine dehydrogenase